MWHTNVVMLTPCTTRQHHAMHSQHLHGPIKGSIDGYYVAYKPITLSCILFMFIEMKFIHCHSCVMFAMKSMSMCND